MKYPKGTGDPNCPPDVREAKRIQRQIEGASYIMEGDDPAQDDAPTHGPVQGDADEESSEGDDEDGGAEASADEGAEPAVPPVAEGEIELANGQEPSTAGVVTGGDAVISPAGPLAATPPMRPTPRHEPESSGAMGGRGDPASSPFVPVPFARVQTPTQRVTGASHAAQQRMKVDTQLSSFGKGMDAIADKMSGNDNTRLQIEWLRERAQEERKERLEREEREAKRAWELRKWEAEKEADRRRWEAELQEQRKKEREEREERESRREALERERLKAEREESRAFMMLLFGKKPDQQ